MSTDLKITDFHKKKHLIIDQLKKLWQIVRKCPALLSLSMTTTTLAQSGAAFSIDLREQHNLIGLCV